MITGLLTRVRRETRTTGVSATGAALTLLTLTGADSTTGEGRVLRTLETVITHPVEVGDGLVTNPAAIRLPAGSV